MDFIATRFPQAPWCFGRGVLADFRRRWRHYASDFSDGICDSRARQKTVSTAAFIVSIVLPTAISLGMLNEKSTHGKMSVCANFIYLFSKLFFKLTNFIFNFIFLHIFHQI
jgi:hypothetical protein